MTTVFNAWPYGTFIERNSATLGERNFIERIKAPISNFSIQFRTENKPQHLKRFFSSRTDPSIFTSIAAVLLDR